MRQKGFRFALWIVCFGILVGGLISAPPKSAQQTNLLQNGSFESGPVGLALTSLPGWTVTRGTVDVLPGAPSNLIEHWQQAADGSKSLDLIGTPGVGSIRQAIPTEAGRRYVFSGWVAHHYGTPEAGANVSVNGVSLQPLYHAGQTTQGNLQWARFSREFVATSTTTTLLLEDRNLAGYEFGGTLLDGLSVTATTSIATVVDHRMTGSVNPNSCSPAPTAKTTFALTDEIAYQWASYSGINNGDVIRWEFIQPNGSVFQTSQDTFNFSGGGCAWEGIRIAGQPAALLPGNWQVRVLYNGAPILTESFTISGNSGGQTGAAVIIDGTDANEHGSASSGQNRNGWLYMQKALENLAGQISAGAAKVIVTLGTLSGSKARDAIDSAFNLSPLPGAGWRIMHVDGASNISAWLANLSPANTGILYLPTYNLTSGDLDAPEMAVINAQADQIARFINRTGNDGGALFAMGESNSGSSTGSWGWLRVLFPAIVVTDVSTGGVTSTMTLTADGMAAFPGLTNSALAGADPWHNYFTGNLGTLKVLGTAPQSGVTRSIIIGGVNIVIPTADLAITQTATPNPVGNGANATFTMTVSNRGPDTAADIVVTDNLPANASFISCNASGGGVCGGTGNNRTAMFSSLGAGASATVTITARVSCVNGGASSVSNTATVASAISDPNLNNNSATTSSAITNCVTNRTVRVACPGAPQSGTVRLPIEMISEGNENALGFSLNFDPAVLGNPQLSLGSDAAGASLNTNTSQVAQGRIGIALALPTGQSFSAGVRQIAVVTFAINANTSANSTMVDFGDAPIRRQISDPNAQSVTAGYQGCTAIGITTGYEADVTPSPNGKGDGSVAITDWVKVGRFAAGLDVPSTPSEHQRADCAPRNTKGDGPISVTDWVQAGRYAAGLDPVQTAGGPSSAQLLIAPDGQSLNSVTGEAAHGRELRAVNTTFLRGRNNALNIELDAHGNENALGFSLNFSPSALNFVSATLGSGASGALLIANTTQVDSGRVGIAVALPAGQKMAAGTRLVVVVTFSAVGSANTTLTSLSFGDQPIKRQASDADAAALDVEYIDAVIKIANPVASVSAASFAGQTLAREAIVAAFGQDLATTTQIATTSPLPTAIAGTTVKVTDSVGTERLAPLFFVSPGQINYLIPEGSASGAATVTATGGNGIASFGAVTLANAAPGLFTANASGQGLPAAIALRIRADGSQSYEPVAQFDPAQNQFVPVPIDLGVANDQIFLLLFGTGWRYRSSLSGVGLKIGGVDSQVSYAGPQGGFVGLDQINALLPRSLNGRGEVEITLTVDGVAANAVRLVIR